MQLLNTQLQFAKDLSIGDQIIFNNRIWRVLDIAHYKNQRTLQMKIQEISVADEKNYVNYFADYTDLFKVLN